MDFDLTYRFGLVGTLAVGSKSQELDRIAITVALRFLAQTIFRLHCRSASLPKQFHSDSIPLSISNVVQITNLRFTRRKKSLAEFHKLEISERALDREMPADYLPRQARRIPPPSTVCPLQLSNIIS